MFVLKGDCFLNVVTLSVGRTPVDFELDLSQKKPSTNYSLTSCSKSPQDLYSRADEDAGCFPSRGFIQR